jgi:hypothetical protein
LRCTKPSWFASFQQEAPAAVLQSPLAWLLPHVSVV